MLNPFGRIIRPVFWDIIIANAVDMFGQGLGWFTAGQIVERAFDKIDNLVDEYKEFKEWQKLPYEEEEKEDEDIVEFTEE